MSQDVPPQYSPDGRWWWDGRQWLRVTPDSPPVPLEPTPPLPVVEATGPRLRVPARALTAGGLVALLVVLGLGLAWLVPQVPWPSLAWLQPAPRSTPVAHPSAGANLPPEKYPYRYMAGVTVSEITELLRAQGFSCQGPEAIGDLGLEQWHCDRQQGSLSYGVSIQAREERKVHLIDAIVISFDQQKPASDVSAPLFDSLSVVPLRNQPTLASQARTWVRGNLANQASTTFGNTAYGTMPGDTDYFLEMDAGFIR